MDPISEVMVDQFEPKRTRFYDLKRNLDDVMNNQNSEAKDPECPNVPQE